MYRHLPGRGIRVFRAAAVCLYACLIAAAMPAQDLETRHDEVVAKALQGFLLGNPEDIHVLARTERPEGLTENIEALGLAAERPVPRLKEKRERLKEYGSDQLTESLDRLIRRLEPRQRFLEARHDRRYEKWRRLYNSVASPVMSVAQGQFFPLFSLPFNAADYLLNGRKFLSPEARRELYTARDAAMFPGPDPVARQARRVLDDWQPRRVKTAALQARQNGERALEDERLYTADFWFRREMALQGWTGPKRKAHLKIGSGRSRKTAERVQANTVADGDLLFYSTKEFSVYTTILRDLILADSEGVAATAGTFLVDHAPSAAVDDAIAARAAAARLNGEDALARVYLRDLPADEPGTPWASRARVYTTRMEFDPEPALAKAYGQSRERFWSFLLQGEDPSILDRSLTAEEARLRRGAWIARAQALFLFDTLSRALALPFMGTFPKPELLDTAQRIDIAWWNTAEGRGWLKRVMKAQAAAKQYGDAARSARLLDNSAKAASYEQKAARHLERLADSQGLHPRASVLIYERLLNAYPSYRHSRRVEGKLADARIDAATRVRVGKEELRAYPELWRGQGLRLEPELLDGRLDNGEISKEGVAILAYEAMAYEDKELGRRLEVPMEKADHEAVLRLLEPRRRAQALDRELAERLPRRKIPLALEAGVLPGFDIRPGLVPLEPDLAQRELYE